MHLARVTTAVCALLCAAIFCAALSPGARADQVVPPGLGGCGGWTSSTEDPGGVLLASGELVPSTGRVALHIVRATQSTKVLIRAYDRRGRRIDLMTGNRYSCALANQANRLVFPVEAQTVATDIRALGRASVRLVVQLINADGRSILRRTITVRRQPGRTVELTLNDYVRGRYGRERAVGTATVQAPARWTFLRDGVPAPPRKVLYTLPVSGGCQLTGQLAVVSVAPHRQTPQAVARQNRPPSAIVASGTLPGGAWALVRYRSAPSGQHALVSANSVLTVAPGRLLLVQSRIFSACTPDASSLRAAERDLEAAARSVRAQVRVEDRA